MPKKGQQVLTCKLHAHHDHTSHPEEEDVMSRLQQGARVEVGQVGGLVGPAHGGEGPDAAAEPGVQHILILTQAHLLAWEALLGLRLRLLLCLGHNPPARVLLPITALSLRPEGCKPDDGGWPGGHADPGIIHTRFVMKSGQ